MTSNEDLELEDIGGESQDRILSVREETEERAPRRAILVRRIGKHLARPAIVIALFAFTLVWVFSNLRALAWYPPWDPYPFTFLATLASLLAPFLSLLILMTQQREAHIAELRDEVSLQVTLHNQRQLTATVRMLRELAERLDARTGVSADSLEHMGQPLDPEHLMEKLRRHLDEAEEESHE